VSRSTCGSCGSGDLQQFLDLGSTPLADAFPKSPDEPEAFYPLGLCVCRKCWLVQNTEVVPDDLLYNDDYGFYTGASPSAVAYFKDYERWIFDHFGCPPFVVEIASNDGTLLGDLDRGDSRILGVEPSANVAAAANARGVPTLNEPFGRRVAQDIGVHSADLIIANNVIAHVSDLDDFVGGIADLLAPGGAAVIEFQYAADLLAFNQFDHVYHEHRSFFSIDSLDAALRLRGLYVESFDHTPAQGGSIRAVVRGGNQPRIATGERWLADDSAYVGFQGRIDRLRSRLRALVWERQHIGPVAGYGASAKSTTLLNYCGFGLRDLDYVADLTPTKIGRYTPGTGIPITDEDHAETYLLLVWNYLAGVFEREAEFRRDGGKFIVPIPMPVLL
jgi:SAM-dependent methyltransferase